METRTDTVESYRNNMGNATALTRIRLLVFYSDER